MAPCIFIHGTNIVNKGLIVLFFGLFCYFSVFFSVAPPLPGRGLIVLFFGLFWLFFDLFPLPALEIFLPTPLSVNDRGINSSTTKTSKILISFH